MSRDAEFPAGGKAGDIFGADLQWHATTPADRVKAFLDEVARLGLFDGGVLYGDWESLPPLLVDDLASLVALYESWAVGDLE